VVGALTANKGDQCKKLLTKYVKWDLTILEWMYFNTSYVKFHVLACDDVADWNLWLVCSTHTHTHTQNIYIYIIESDGELMVVFWDVPLSFIPLKYNLFWTLPYQCLHHNT
jgi:hypothetical protein